MGLEKEKEAALARLRSASGHVSVEIPSSVRLGGEELNPKDIIARYWEGGLTEEEKESALFFLGNAVSEAEERIRDAETAGEVEKALLEALGARRAAHVLRGNANAEGGELEDARRWHRYAKKIG